MTHQTRHRLVECVCVMEPISGRLQGAESKRWRETTPVCAGRCTGLDRLPSLSPALLHVPYFQGALPFPALGRCPAGRTVVRGVNTSRLSNSICHCIPHCDGAHGLEGLRGQVPPALCPQTSPPMFLSKEHPGLQSREGRSRPVGQGSTSAHPLTLQISLRHARFLPAQ